MKKNFIRKATRVGTLYRQGRLRTVTVKGCCKYTFFRVDIFITVKVRMDPKRVFQRQETRLTSGCCRRLRKRIARLRLERYLIKEDHCSKDAFVVIRAEVSCPKSRCNNKRYESVKIARNRDPYGYTKVSGSRYKECIYIYIILLLDIHP